MATEKITIYGPEEAVTWLVQIEGAIKAARSIYSQAMKNGLPIDSDTRLEIMMEIEEKGVHLNRVKYHILEGMNARSYPITFDRI